MYNQSVTPLYITADDVTTARLHGTSDALFVTGELCAEWHKQIAQYDLPKDAVIFNQYCILAMLFEVGRMQGIREERAKKKQTQATQEGVKNERVDNESQQAADNSNS